MLANGEADCNDPLHVDEVRRLERRSPAESTGYMDDCNTMINRRYFLQSAAIAALAGSFGVAAKGAPAAGAKWRGVNLGGWLAPEKWISPTVYAGVQAEDEFTLCQALGREKA